MVRTTRSTFSGCALALVATACASSGLPAAPPRSLDEVLESIRARHGVPAIAALVMERGGVVASGCAGRRAREPVGTNDAWHLGSCGKAMTATVIARLIEERRLAWKTTMASVFPELAAEMHVAMRAVTVRQLLDHRSGLPANTTAGSAFTRGIDRHAPPGAQRLEITAEALSAAPAGMPGETYAYANTNYLIAGAVIERITGQTWEHTMHELLFTPLGMATAGFGQPDDGNAATALPAYYGPAGDVHCSLADWAKFVRVHCGDRDAAAALGLSAATLAAMHTPVAGADHACGFVVREAAGGTGPVLVHQGQNLAWRAFVVCAPTAQRIVLVACNHGGDAGAAVIAEVAASLGAR